MRLKMVLRVLGLGLLVLALQVQSESNQALEKLVNGGHRSAENIARNQYRHPVETLTFFGLKPDMTVVEVWPGGGWYMEILAPYLKEKGRYIAAGFDPNSEVEYFAKNAKKLHKKIDANPDLYDKVKVSSLDLPKSISIAPVGSADMVLTFRNTHNWMRKPGHAEKAFQAMFSALKPGGVLGLVQHRENPDVKQDPKVKSGYVTEAEVIRLAKRAGFRLEASSEINANPKDTRDHPKGVWTLPPVLRDNIDDKKYLAIGESDRMTLKFVKPMSTLKKL